MIRGITFDVFHTLVQDAGAAAAHGRRKELIHRWCQSREVSISRARVVTAYAAAEAERDSEKILYRHFAVAELASSIVTRVGLTCDPHEIEGLAAQLNEALLDGEFVVARGLETCLRTLRDLGLRLGLISNVGWQTGTFVRRTLVELGLWQYFTPEACVFSDEVGYYKPHPAAFQASVAGLGLHPAEVLHVGDDYAADYLGARRSALNATLMTTFRADHAPAGTPAVAGFAQLVDYIKAGEWR
ncbi:HAD family hydrolase [Micromonospora sp. NPDC006766]|uniref:HAD family hydrolase n=1 Tax=Micromonospora sp. NPDC006766 TaxID=3154778 RepID=UPI0033F510EC